jgi:hypothetical protein
MAMAIIIPQLHQQLIGLDRIVLFKTEFALANGTKPISARRCSQA